ncbi:MULTISPECIES: ion transporter [Haloarcula]|uniref:ion transporter n=1 Tax=Haloarcula TaxID=2237 RepID=UPI0023E8B7DC|nr:ion transporter [Halomicroarcula sp. SHR3]
MLADSPSADDGFRQQVRFYLLDHESYLGKAIDISLLVLNLLFVAVYVAQTYPLASETRTLLWRLEVAIGVVFALEYALRLYGAADRWAEFFNGYTMVDLLAILPTFVLVALPVSAVPFNVGFLRVLRVIRVMRFYRFTDDAEFFFGTIDDNTLRSVRLLLTVLVLFFVSAGLFYSAEVGTNPDVTTFGDAFYYVVVAITTVGFGDIIPVTQAGRWVTVGAIIVGIIVIPWQAGKIVREWQTRDKVEVTCPDCGLSSHDADASHCKACGHLIYQEYDSRE